NRETQQQKQDQVGEHDRCEVINDEDHHDCTLLSGSTDGVSGLASAISRISSASCSSAEAPLGRARGSGPAPVRKAMHLIRWDTPARMSNEIPTGSNNLTGQRISPPVLDDCSMNTTDL